MATTLPANENAQQYDALFSDSEWYSVVNSMSWNSQGELVWATERNTGTVEQRLRTELGIGLRGFAYDAQFERPRVSGSKSDAVFLEALVWSVERTRGEVEEVIEAIDRLLGSDELVDDWKKFFHSELRDPKLFT